MCPTFTEAWHPQADFRLRITSQDSPPHFANPSTCIALNFHYPPISVD
jgi:hypothetical protein